MVAQSVTSGQVFDPLDFIRPEQDRHQPLRQTWADAPLRRDVP